MPLNISPTKEILILIGGPIFQCIAYKILMILLPLEIDIINNYHHNILIFNLLPIYPLDGGKLLKIVLDLFLPYKTSYKYIIYISYFLEIIYFILIPTKRINSLLTFLFLVFLTYQESHKINIIYEKFLLERYLNNYIFSKTKIISDINNFYRNRKHLIKYSNQYYLEKEVLSKKYFKIDKNC